MPKRIQLSRKRGWRKPEGAVVCSRPSKFGNPFVVEACEGHADCNRFVVTGPGCNTVCVEREEAFAYAIERYRKALELRLLRVSPDDVRRELRGKDLACWCPIGHPCHVDVLLEIANG